jgi:8-oxo-dGTP diphosphatase
MKLATLCYLKKNKKTLMIKTREDSVQRGIWNGLGGKFKEGESAEECCVREVLEESGLKVKDPQLKGFLSFPECYGQDDWYVFVFTATKFSGKLKHSNEGKLEWIDDKKLLKLRLWGGDKIFLPLLKQKRFFTAKIVYDNSKGQMKLKSHKITLH